MPHGWYSTQRRLGCFRGASWTSVRRCGFPATPYQMLLCSTAWRNSAHTPALWISSIVSAPDTNRCILLKHHFKRLEHHYCAKGRDDSIFKHSQSIRKVSRPPIFVGMWSSRCYFSNIEAEGMAGLHAIDKIRHHKKTRRLEMKMNITNSHFPMPSTSRLTVFSTIPTYCISASPALM